MHRWNDGWHMGWMTLWWILGIAGLALLFGYLVRAPRDVERSAETPDAVLRRRYAAGEINGETFQRMTDDLRQ